MRGWRLRNLSFNIVPRLEEALIWRPNILHNMNYTHNSWLLSQTHRLFESTDPPQILDDVGMVELLCQADNRKPLWICKILLGS